MYRPSILLLMLHRNPNLKIKWQQLMTGRIFQVLIVDGKPPRASLIRHKNSLDSTMTQEAQQRGKGLQEERFHDKVMVLHLWLICLIRGDSSLL